MRSLGAQTFVNRSQTVFDTAFLCDTRPCAYAGNSCRPWLRPRKGMASVLVRASHSSEEMREQVKRLTKLFYFNKPGTSAPIAESAAMKRTSDLCIQGLPLWRTEWSVLPGCQEFLHVLAPHYVHMFEAIFSKPRPWRFGHLYLPGGSKNLGSPSYQLTSGSQAPLIGVLVHVTRAVRLRDGKFLILATCCARFKVTRCLQELPYSIADVELLEDAEVLESFNEQAMTAVMQTAPEDISISSLMAAGSSIAREAAAAVSWAWLKGYELAVAVKQEWPGPGPREGETDLETHLLVQELMAHGVSEVLPLPDGVVIGRCDLQQVVAAADTSLQQSLADAAQRLQSGDKPAKAVDAGDSSRSSPMLAGPLTSYEGSSTIVSLNTTVDRGVKFEGPEFTELTSSTATSSSTEDVLMLEAAVWAQLDTLVALASRVKGTRHVLPFGLLQLRPPPIQPLMKLNRLHDTNGSAGPAAADVDAGGDEIGNAENPAAGGDSGTKAFEGSWVNGLQPSPVAEIGDDLEDANSEGTSACSPGNDISTNSIDSSSSSTSSDDVISLASNASSTAWQEHGTVKAVSSSKRSASQQPAEMQHVASASRYAYAASDGCDAHADPLWPPLRRAARLSWAVASVLGQMEQDTSEMKQALLEVTSIAQRLRFALAVLGKHVKVLAAVAAVKGVQE